MKLGTLAPLGLSAMTAVLLGAIGSASSSLAGSATAAGAAGSAGSAVAWTALIETKSPFSHDTHLDASRMGKALQCSGCHAMLDADGACPSAEVRLPSHEACTECHAASFYTMPLTICSNCHESARFAKPNPLRALERVVTPRKAQFSHKAHLQRQRDLDCTSCHAVQKGGAVMGHASHPSCCRCHATGSTAARGKAAEPAMDQCTACHREDESAGRRVPLIQGFSHKDHREDPRTGRTTSCRLCHVNMKWARSLATIEAPPMATCVVCHDGSDPTRPNPRDPAQRGTGAFHFSACLRCHVPGKIAGMRAPLSHQLDKQLDKQLEKQRKQPARRKR